MIKASSLAIAAALFALAPEIALAAGPGGSQPRAWVSGSGSDVSTCGTIKTPCRTFQYAHDSIVAPGGTIYVQDAANYVGTAPFTITHAISIINDGVGAATIVAASGDAIDIQAGPKDAVFIKGLILDGAGTGINGINLSSAGNLTLAHCIIKGFGTAGNASLSGNGVLLYPTSGSVTFNIFDTIITGSGSVAINSQSNGGAASGNLKNVTVTNNTFGLAISAASSSVTVVDSFFSQNALTGMQVGAGSLSVSNSVSIGNGYFDLATTSVGSLTTYQNNVYNTTSGTFTKGGLH